MDKSSINSICNKLAKKIGEPKTELYYRNPFTFLVSVGVAIVRQDLFAWIVVVVAIDTAAPSYVVAQPRAPSKNALRRRACDQYTYICDMGHSS